MTLLRKTSICLMLTIVFTVATRSAPAQTAPAILYGSDAVPSSGVTIGSSSAATPVRYSTGFRYGSSDNSVSEAVLVVPATETDAETVARIAEDLIVMGRIIEKNALSPYVSTGHGALPLLGRLRAEGAMRPEVLFGAIGRPRPLYIGGYGAAFFIQVDFPLLAPPERAQQPSATSQDDRVWAETRRSLLEPPAAGVVVPRSGPSVQPYNPDRVDGLKKSLISVMKHATNVRGLESAEWLTIVVQGIGSPASAESRPPAADAATPVARQVMTLRAKKADVDAYAAGQLNEAQFEQRVQVMTY